MRTYTLLTNLSRDFLQFCKFVVFMDSGQEIKDFLKREKINKDKLASRLNVSRQTLYNWLDKDINLEHILNALASINDSFNTAITQGDITQTSEKGMNKNQNLANSKSSEVNHHYNTQSGTPSHVVSMLIESLREQIKYFHTSITEKDFIIEDMRKSLEAKNKLLERLEAKSEAGMLEVFKKLDAIYEHCQTCKKLSSQIESVNFSLTEHKTKTWKDLELIKKKK